MPKARRKARRFHIVKASAVVALSLLHQRLQIVALHAIPLTKEWARKLLTVYDSAIERTDSKPSP